VDATLLLVLGLAAMFAAIALAMSIIGAITSEKAAVGRSLAAVEAMQAAPASMRTELDRPFADRVLTPTMDRLTRIGRRFTPADRADRVRRKLELAGSPAGWDVDRVLAFKALGIFAGAGLGLLIAWLFGLGFIWLLVITIGLAVLGWFAPDLALYQAAYNRSEQIRKELPDSLDLLTISVEAGLGFDAALSQVARNTSGPLSEEFFRVLQEMQIGVGRSEAMRALADRTDVAELRGFVTAMVQADKFGIPIANVLRVQSRELRIKRSQLAEERAQKVPVKILFPLIFCIMPALFIVILGPAAITIFEAFRRAG
jgi:tight adherence protein C